MNNVGVVVVHNTSEWKALSALLSSKLTPDLTLQYDGGDGAEPDRVRHIETPSVKPEAMLSLPRGHAWFLREGTAMEVKVARPDTSGHKPFELPAQEELYLPLGLGEQDETGKGASAPGFLAEPKKEGFHRDEFEVPDGLGQEGKNTEPPPADPDAESDHEPDPEGRHDALPEIPKESESGDRPDEDAPPLDAEEEGDEGARIDEGDSVPGFLATEPKEKGPGRDAVEIPDAFGQEGEDNNSPPGDPDPEPNQERDSEGPHDALSEIPEDLDSGDRSNGSDEDAPPLDAEEEGDEKDGIGEEDSVLSFLDSEPSEGGFRRADFEIPGHLGLEEDELPPEGPDPT